MNEKTLMQNRTSGHCLRSLKTGEEFYLVDEMLVGREVECQIALNSGHISRYHAKLTLTPKGVLVEDLSSTNGTFINGRRISEPQILSVGDEVRFHEQAFRLVSSQQGSGDADATVFHRVDGTVRPVVVAPAPRPAAAPAPVIFEPEDDNTRILSLDELQRLQGKADRPIKGPENGTGPRFVVLTAPIRGKVFSLRSQQRNAWLIGRDQSCQFNLSDKTVSGEHARVRRLADEWVLETCEGRNPLYINNRQVQLCTLQHGDVVRIGRMELMFRSDETAVPPAKRGGTGEARVSRFNLMLMGGALFMLVVVVGVILALIKVP